LSGAYVELRFLGIHRAALNVSRRFGNRSSSQKVDYGALAYASLSEEDDVKSLWDMSEEAARPLDHWGI